MGNSKRIFSPGTVEITMAFEDDPTNIMTVTAYVVENFTYDLLLGKIFLEATSCLKRIHLSLRSLLVSCENTVALEPAWTAHNPVPGAIRQED
jgi:hypothetical protein